MDIEINDQEIKNIYIASQLTFLNLISSKTTKKWPNIKLNYDRNAQKKHINTIEL